MGAPPPPPPVNLMSSMAMSPAQEGPLTPMNDTSGWLTPPKLIDAESHLFPLFPFELHTLRPDTSTISVSMLLPYMWYLKVMVSFPPRIRGGVFKTAFWPGLRGAEVSMYI